MVLKGPIQAEVAHANLCSPVKPWEDLCKTGELTVPSKLRKWFGLLQSRIPQFLTNWSSAAFESLRGLTLLIG